MELLFPVPILAAELRDVAALCQPALHLAGRSFAGFRPSDAAASAAAAAAGPAAAAGAIAIGVVTGAAVAVSKVDG